MNYQLDPNELDFMAYLKSLLKQKFNNHNNHPLFTLTKESHMANADGSAIHCYVYEPHHTSISPQSPKEIYKGQYEAIKRRVLTPLSKYIIPKNYRKVYQNQVDNTFIFESDDHDLITYKITDTNIIITIQYSGQY